MADTTVSFARPRRQEHGDTIVLANADLNDSDKSFTVPEGETWLVRSAYVELVTTATAGNRVVTVRQTNSADETLASSSAATQAASLTHRYTFTPGGQVATGSSAVQGAVYPLPEVVLPAGAKVRVFDSAAVDAAADDMTVRLVIERYKFA